MVEFAGKSSSSRMRIWHQRGASFLKDGNSKLATDRREVIEKDFERIARFKVIEERLDGDSRTREHGSSAVNLWIDDD